MFALPVLDGLAQRLGRSEGDRVASARRALLDDCARHRSADQRFYQAALSD